MIPCGAASLVARNACRIRDEKRHNLDRCEAHHAQLAREAQERAETALRANQRLRQLENARRTIFSGNSYLERNIDDISMEIDDRMHLGELILNFNRVCDSCSERITQNDDAEAVRICEGVTGPGIFQSLLEARLFARQHRIEDSAELVSARERSENLLSAMSSVFLRDNHRRAEVYRNQYRENMLNANREWDAFRDALARNNIQEAREHSEHYRNLTREYQYLYESGTYGYNGCSTCLEAELTQDGPILIERFHRVNEYLLRTR